MPVAPGEDVEAARRDGSLLRPWLRDSERPNPVGPTTTWPMRHVARSSTESLEKYSCSLVATFTCPTALTTARRSTTTPQ